MPAPGGHPVVAADSDVVALVVDEVLCDLVSDVAGACGVQQGDDASTPSQSVVIQADGGGGAGARATVESVDGDDTDAEVRG